VRDESNEDDIFAMMAGALAEFAFRPAAPWYEALSVLFGIGAALTLDEYALWLHLGDVYWSQEGRASVDVVVYAATIGAVLLVAANPFARKGKSFTSVCGVLVPLLAVIGAIRLAKPGSPWARWFYSADGSKLARARQRESDRSTGKLARWRDSLVGLGPGAR